MNLTDLHTFALVVEQGTISAAARHLAVPKSTVSRRVRRLERDLKRELLIRTPNAVVPSEYGTILFKRVSPSLKDLGQAGDVLSSTDGEPSGRLRLTTTPGFGQDPMFVDCIAEFGLKFPKVIIELVLTNHVVNLVEEGFDVAVRLHKRGVVPGSQSLMSRHLLDLDGGLYASPDYIDEMGLPERPDQLSGHRLALHSRIEALSERWCRGGATVESPFKTIPARWLSDDMSTLEKLALRGASLTFLQKTSAQFWIEKGSLIPVLPEYSHEAGSATMVWPQSRFMAPRVRAFIDHCSGHMSLGPARTL